MEKFGKDVALASMEGEGVAERVLKKTALETPKAELVDAYLTEIARFYGVPFGEATPEPEDDEEDDDDEPSGGVAEEAEAEPPLETKSGKNKAAKKRDEEEELVKATPPKKFGPQSPLRVMPPSPSTDNVAPRLKLPGAAASKLSKSEAQKPAKKDDGPGGKIPDVDELAKRFAQLKR
jgi:vacuolar protein sorting-associated protein IST1